MALNGFSLTKHRIIAADCLEWLETERNQYDLIFLDPPTFSNSKNMNTSFSVQHDHAGLIKKVMARLSPDGILIFSTNLRKFKLDHEALSGHRIEDWTAGTMPPDFRRRSRAHKCWKITE